MGRKSVTLAWLDHVQDKGALLTLARGAEGYLKTLPSHMFARLTRLKDDPLTLICKSLLRAREGGDPHHAGDQENREIANFWLEFLKTSALNRGGHAHG